MNAHARTARFVALGCVIFLLAGCIGPLSGLNRFNPFSAGDKPREGEDSESSGPADLVDFVPEVQLDRIWSRKVGRGLGKKYIEIVPAIVEDRVLVADAYGTVMALNRLDGEVFWKTRVGRPDSKGLFDVNNRSDPSFVAGGIGVGEGLLFLGTVRGDIIALDIGDGKEIWRTQLSGEILSPAVADQGIVAVQTSDGKLYALEVASGDVRWVFDTQDPILTLRGTGYPVIERNHVFAGFANGLVASVEIESGFPAWEQRIALPEGTSELERMVDVDGRPLVMESVVYAVSHQGKLRAMSRADGSILWEKDEPSHHSLAEGYDLLFVVRDDDVVVAAEQNGGSEVWRQDALFKRELSDPLAYSNYLIMGDDKGYVHVLAQSDGRMLGRARHGKSLRSPMIEERGVVYAMNRKGRLAAFRISRIE
ncbi:MAG: outer membrane protein assembly factor BamB [Gammaproteobacteria bacterium]|nr:outer membrane protein assembly factor BamB [Gammaproteobacteria bacterium]